MVNSRISASCQPYGATSEQSIAYSLADVTFVSSNYVMIWHVNTPLIFAGDSDYNNHVHYFHRLEEFKAKSMP